MKILTTSQVFHVSGGEKGTENCTPVSRVLAVGALITIASAFTGGVMGGVMGCVSIGVSNGILVGSAVGVGMVNTFMLLVGASSVNEDINQEPMELR
ncbi:MAG: hypothetical protein JSS07_10605 [Proteobacteria bacterium]|nr:hypothetical protein [Pseudomonadota bacterium]